MKSIPTVVWGLFIMFLVVPVYLNVQKRRYNIALQNFTKVELLKPSTYRVSVFAHLQALVFFLMGWGILIDGIQRWVHSSHGAQFMMVSGVLFIFLGIGLHKGLLSSYVVLDAALFEYKSGKHTIRVKVEDIISVELKVTQLSGYILIRARNQDDVQLPMHFGRGPELFAILKCLTNDKDSAR
ncbi:MAG: hypothetical protein P4N60_10860 [Verrucomicrobiae bacterium]|nr:hypothetical protein [Verrucomicrobiae bacterium]